ncbi:hypothetical protein K8T06_17605, partial [bacterium]|nr:hypothetical protein [bacterium]
MPKDNSSLELVQISNANLLPYLSLNPIYNAHSLFVCEQKPMKVSAAVISKITGNIEAVLITGQPDIFLL